MDVFDLSRDPAPARMGRKIRKPEAQKMLGVSPGGIVSLLARRKFNEYRDDDGLPRYDEDEIRDFIARENWKGPKRHPVDVLKRNSDVREIRKAKYVALAMQGILEGKERYQLIIELACPSDWIDRAYAELCESYETAQERASMREKAAKEEREREEHDKQQKQLERILRENIRGRNR